ncbi:hypothetical protein C8Q74DRAFT_1222744 [Fomes fomentarius]|nr:hypothetical protein C8Q74DRAFT_1222744 [Fomes fomentarius]
MAPHHCKPQPPCSPEGRFLKTPEPISNFNDMAPPMPPTEPAATMGQDATQTPGASSSTAATATAQALAAVSNQTNFTADQVQLLLQSFAAVLGSQNNGRQLPTAAFPAFTFMPLSVPPAGASLLDLFPTIDSSVLLEITRHEFKPGDLYKLDTRHNEHTSRQVLELSSRVVLVRNKAPRDYPSFNSLYIPLSTYFNVLAGFASTGGDANALYHLSSSTAVYLARLAQFSQDYQWSATVAYHFGFHYTRRRNML